MLFEPAVLPQKQKTGSHDVARRAPGTTWSYTSNKYDFVLN
jgi:hypothetical protein